MGDGLQGTQSCPAASCGSGEQQRPVPCLWGPRRVGGEEERARCRRDAPSLCAAGTAQGEARENISEAVGPQTPPHTLQNHSPKTPQGPPRPWLPALGADVPGEPVHKELKAASPGCEFSASLPHAAKQQLDIFHPSRERQRREDIPMIPFCMPNYELRCSSICPGPASST